MVAIFKRVPSGLAVGNVNGPGDLGIAAVELGDDAPIRVQAVNPKAGALTFDPSVFVLEASFRLRCSPRCLGSQKVFVRAVADASYADRGRYRAGYNR
jgi:hypothetical protein